jgi:hypothetical protein
MLFIPLETAISAGRAASELVSFVLKLSWNFKITINGENLLDIELDMNELLELRNMALRPWVRRTLLTIVTKLEKDQQSEEVNHKMKRV